MKRYFIITIIVFALIISGFFLTRSIILKDVENTSWKLTGWSSTEVSPSVATITLNFKNGKISGNGGVNSYNGVYTVGLKNKILLTDIMSTEMASEDANINKAESLYFSLLAKVEYYEINNNTLNLLDGNKNVLLIFNKN